MSSDNPDIQKTLEELKARLEAAEKLAAEEKAKREEVERATERERARIKKLEDEKGDLLDSLRLHG